VQQEFRGYGYLNAVSNISHRLLNAQKPNGIQSCHCFGEVKETLSLSKFGFRNAAQKIRNETDNLRKRRTKIHEKVYFIKAFRRAEENY
jgi:hypothetical protein